MIMWYTLAIAATILTSLLVLGIKYATTRGFDPAFILFLSFSTSALCALLHIKMSKIEIRMDIKVIVLIVICGVISYAGNLLLTKSIKIAPNPGYTQAILSTNVVIIAVLSYFLFNTELSVKNIIGAFICILGVIIL